MKIKSDTISNKKTSIICFCWRVKKKEDNFYPKPLICIDYQSQWSRIVNWHGKRNYRMSYPKNYYSSKNYKSNKISYILLIL